MTRASPIEISFLEENQAWWIEPSVVVERRDRRRRARAAIRGLCSLVHPLVRAEAPAPLVHSPLEVDARDIGSLHLDTTATAVSWGDARHVIGGNALTPEVRRQLEFSAHGDNLRHLLAIAQTLLLTAVENGGAGRPKLAALGWWLSP